MLSVSRKEPAIPPHWYTVVTYPLEGSNNPDRMFRSFYYEVGAWLDADPVIARYMLEEVAEYARTDGASGMPESMGYLDFARDRGKHGWAIKAGWRESPEVLSYLDLKGYTPPPPDDDPASIKQRLLVEARKDPGLHRDTALHRAVLGGYEDVVRLLLAEGADVNAMNDSGETPLHYAAWRADTAIAELLLSHGADTGAETDVSRTPLDWALWADRDDIADLIRRYERSE
jgi:hypothetical protein